MDSRTELETWQGRVLDEKKELDSKINKLFAFLASGNLANVDEKHLHLLKQQYDVMCAYSSILQKRIDLLE